LEGLPLWVAPLVPKKGIKMKKYIITALCLVAALSVYAADNVTRYRGQTLSQGGTTSLNGSTVVESSSPTNAFKIVVVTAAVTGGQTASTNTFATSFVATPTAYKGIQSGANATQISNSWAVGATVSTSTLIVTGLSTNADTGVNSLPVMVYGYTRTGQFE
jgi:hypothetical protein